MEKILKVIAHPVTYTNLIIVGTLILIEFFHTKAHYTMEVDVHGVCLQHQKNSSVTELDTFEEDY
tara:strand:+ start:3237 stop:3431 length:195 start_codon:yes stop_codon:yes gene_type:complete